MLLLGDVLVFHQYDRLCIVMNTKVTLVFSDIVIRATLSCKSCCHIAATLLLHALLLLSVLAAAVHRTPSTRGGLSFNNRKTEYPPFWF